MREFAFTVNLKSDKMLISEYKLKHQNVWVEVTNSLKRVGIVEMKIFISGATLFMHIKTNEDFDPLTSFEKYHTLDPKIKEWENLMNTFKEDKNGSNQWVLMDQIFDMK
jgi:L-rhamnose mutarotase